MMLFDWLFLAYVLGAVYALGSASAAILRGETGILGLMWPNPPIWALVVEVLLAGLFSIFTIGFCHVSNAYRSAGNPGLVCGAKR